MFEVLKRVPWASIGSVALTAAGATITAITNRRNQERVIEKVGKEVAKEVIKHQESNNF